MKETVWHELHRHTVFARQKCISGHEISQKSTHCGFTADPVKQLNKIRCYLHSLLSNDHQLLYHIFSTACTAINVFSLSKSCCMKSPFFQWKRRFNFTEIWYNDDESVCRPQFVSSLTDSRDIWCGDLTFRDRSLALMPQFHSCLSFTSLRLLR